MQAFRDQFLGGRSEGRRHVALFFSDEVMIEILANVFSANRTSGDYDCADKVMHVERPGDTHS